MRRDGTFGSIGSRNAGSIATFASARRVAEFSAKRAGLPPEKLVVIPNGIDLDKYPARQPADLRAFGIAAGRRAVTFVGRLEPQKGVDWLIATAPHWLAKLPDCDLLLVGDGPLRPSLEAAAKAAGIADRVHFAGWRPDVPEILAASSLLVLPSLWEGMPNVVLEAMASRLPVVASDVEGVRELLGPNAARQTVAHGDSRAACRGDRRLDARPCFVECDGTGKSPPRRRVFRHRADGQALRRPLGVVGAGVESACECLRRCGRGDVGQKHPLWNLLRQPPRPVATPSGEPLPLATQPIVLTAVLPTQGIAVTETGTSGSPLPESNIRSLAVGPRSKNPANSANSWPISCEKAALYALPPNRYLCGRVGMSWHAGNNSSLGHLSVRSLRVRTAAPICGHRVGAGLRRCEGEVGFHGWGVKEASPLRNA